MSAGWISIHRKIQGSDLWLSEPFTRGQAWVDLILLANYKESSFYKRGNRVVVPRGCLARSILELSDRWGWDRRKVSKFLNDIEKDGKIAHQKSSLTTLIYITKYDEYQKNSTADSTTDSTTEGTTDRTHTISKQLNKETIKAEKKQKKPTTHKKHKFTEDDTKCANYIFSGVRRLNPTHKKPNLDSWSDVIRLMRESDRKTHLEICELFKWANNDDFWKGNILSPSKLRKQWDKLIIKRGSEKKQGGLNLGGNIA